MPTGQSHFLVIQPMPSFLPELLGCEELHDLIQLVLKTGNYMNEVPLQGSGAAWEKDPLEPPLQPRALGSLVLLVALHLGVLWIPAGSLLLYTHTVPLQGGHLGGPAITPGTSQLV